MNVFTFPNALCSDWLCFYHHSFYLDSWLPSLSLKRLVLQLIFNSLRSCFISCCKSYLTVFPRIWRYCLQQLSFSHLYLFFFFFSSLHCSPQFLMERKTNATTKTAKLGSRKCRRKVLSLLGLAAQVTLLVMFALLHFFFFFLMFFFLKQHRDWPIVSNLTDFIIFVLFTVSLLCFLRN